MKKYCLDTSGLSNPLESMPEDIHSSLWLKIAGLVVDGKFAVTAEIYEELGHLPGPIGPIAVEPKFTKAVAVPRKLVRQPYTRAPPGCMADRNREALPVRAYHLSSSRSSNGGRSQPSSIQPSQ